MFLGLEHTKLDVFKVTREFVLACYQLPISFPIEEKFGMISQVRRAALSVHLNLAEGCSRKSESERKRFYEIARGSIIEIDTALDIAIELGSVTKQQSQGLGDLMIRSFQMISKMIS